MGARVPTLFTSDTHGSCTKGSKPQRKLRVESIHSLLQSSLIQSQGGWFPHSFSQGLFLPCPCLSCPSFCLLYMLLFSHPYLKICHLSPSEVALPTHFEQLPLGLHGSLHLCFGIEMQRRGGPSTNSGLCTGPDL